MVVSGGARRALVAGGLLVALVLGAAGPIAAEDTPAGDRLPTMDAAVAPALDSGVLTVDGLDRYAFTPGPGSVRVVAPATNRGQNLRTVWWPTGAPATVDGEACATWTASLSRIAQPGIALRVRRDAGRLRAITLTNNIWLGDRTTWNVHGWDTAAGGLRPLGAVSLPGTFGPLASPPALPWRMCARVRGTTYQVRAWPVVAGVPEPTWGDPRYGASFTLPETWVYGGRAGWYVGHLSPGEVAIFEQLGAWRLHGSAADLRFEAVDHWVAGLYPLMFGRAADADRSYWVEAAGTRGPDWVVASMSTMAEGRSRTVTEVYQRVLRRDPDDAGRAFWAERLLRQPNVESLTLSVVLSPEFSGQRDDEALVAALYERILERAVDPAGVAFWVDRLEAGWSRARVASSFVLSAENRTRTTDRVFTDVLGRSPDAEELVGWTERFAALGLNQLRLRAALAATTFPR